MNKILLFLEGDKQWHFKYQQVNVSEVDLTTVDVSTTARTIAGHFVETADRESTNHSEDRLVSNFSGPNANTADDFFTAANFLAYGNSLVTVRVVDSSVQRTLFLALWRYIK